jgi:predicted kinase
MSTLLITQGISGSGKSTWAKAFVAKDAENWVRSSRDDLRTQMFGTPTYDEIQEKAVDVAQEGMVRALLTAGKNVVVDNTHLNVLAIDYWQNLAHFMGVDFAVKPFNISVEGAKANVAKRAAAGGLFVPDNIIETQHSALVNLAEKHPWVSSLSSTPETY